LPVAAQPSNEVVYDNSVNSLRKYFNPQKEFGDEIILESAVGPVDSCTITSITFEYIGLYFSGNEQAQLRLYLNDGPYYGNVARKPGTLVYESGPFNIVGSATGYAYRKAGLAIPATPGHFTWTIEFLGLSGNESAGLSIYSPPRLGNNYDDYWERAGTNWVLKTVSGVPMNFGALITATNILGPELAPIELRLLGIRNGVATVSVAGPGERQYVVEASSDLKDWVVITNFISNTMPMTVTDKDVSRFTRRFYRAKLANP
jgi:hypothetical protein